MKLKNLISLLIVTQVLGSCAKVSLNQPIQGALSEDLLANQKGVTELLTGAYAALAGQTNEDLWWTAPSNWIYGSTAGGDAHKGSTLDDQGSILPIQGFYDDPTNDGFDEKWKSMYEGISRCNAVLRIVKNATDISDEDKTNIKAQAHLLRGYYYFELKKMFNMVPWIDENSTDFNQPNNEDIWPDIITDFRFGYDSLPATQAQMGRLNKWAAGAMLGKAYIFQQNYQEAKTIFDQVIMQGETSNGIKYNLAPQFEDNFLPEREATNPEAVFPIQMAANVDGNSFWHANAGETLNFPYNGPFTCCGFFQPSQDLVNHYRTNPSTGLPYIDDYNQFPVKSDMGIASNISFVPDAGTLDPRLDWTVGRRGIPYLDWGNHPGQDWIVDQTSAGPYSPIKNVYWQATAKDDYDPNFWAPGTAINILVIRFADVLLMAAECETQIGNLDKAEEYVNLVRLRAANPTGWVYKYKDPGNPLKGFSNVPAANYFIKPYPQGYFSGKGKDYSLKIVYYEEQIELAMEGHRFFDLVRWGIADQELNTYFEYEGQITTDLQRAHFTKGKNEYYPIPQAEIDLSEINGKPQLQQNKGYK